MTPARVVWKKADLCSNKSNADKQAKQWRDVAEVRARVVKEVWWRVEYAEKGR